MWRAIRRWWARVSHRHEYEVIFRGYVLRPAYNRKDHCVLERCYCSAERARVFYWDSWHDLDLDWLNAELASKGVEIPARTHGVKNN